jgi:hypothetical protein
MKVFFDYDDSGSQPRSPAEAIDASLDEALGVLRKLRRERSFLGVMLPNDRVLQFYVAEAGVLWLEILDRRARLTEGALVSLPIAETALRACFEGKEIRATLEPYLLDWTADQL